MYMWFERLHVAKYSQLNIISHSQQETGASRVGIYECSGKNGGLGGTPAHVHVVAGLRDCM